MAYDNLQSAFELGVVTTEPIKQYVQVKPKGGGRSSYQLTVNAESVEDKADIFNMGDLSVLETYSNNDRIGFTQRKVRNKNDYYTFTLSEDTRVDIGLNQFMSDANMELLDSSGSLITRSKNKGRRPERITEELEAGDYRVRVYPQGRRAKTRYTLTVLSETIEEDLDNIPPGEDIGVLGNYNEEDRTLDSASNPLTAGGVLISSRNSEATYTFDLAQSDFLTVTIDDLKANANLELYASNGKEVLGSSSNSGTSPEEIEVFLEQDTYLVEVLGQGQATSFDLSVGFG